MASRQSLCDDSDRDRHRGGPQRKHRPRGLALVAVDGGYGTLSEIALALQFGRPVLTLLDAPAVSGVRPVDSVEATLDAVSRLVLALPA